MNVYIVLIFIGAISGFIGGMLGGGSDVLIVPMLLYFGVFKSIKPAIGTSLAALIPPIGIFAATTLYKQGFGDINAAMYMALLFTIASFFSAKLTIKVDTDILSKIFGIFTIICGLYIFFNKQD